jgi:hypothetical protein
MKHTALDFFRRVKINPNIGLGHHAQIIEIQCQREYEGKGAFPCYIGHLIADGNPESATPLGLRAMLEMPQVQGVFTWSRGGGWFGPYLKNEFWCRLNTYVISALVRDTTRSETDIFNDFCRGLGLSDSSASSFRKACLLSSEALLLGRYCEAYDQKWQEATIPTELWMRDDRLGGMDQLAPIFRYLHQNGMTTDAIQEKKESVKLWKQALLEFKNVAMPNSALQEMIEVSFRYGLGLFEIICIGWEILSLDYVAQIGVPINKTKLRQLQGAYDDAWSTYRSLQEFSVHCATLYNGKFWNWPGKPALPGLDSSVKNAMRHLGEEPLPLEVQPAVPAEKSWFGVGVDGAV